MEQNTELSIREVLNTDYLEYGKYVVYNRALPYLSDGFKPTQRKIIYIALKHARKSMINVSALGGFIKAQAKYHHADSSLDGQIINLAQDFKCSLPYFIRGGQFGTVYSPEASASRYLEVQLSSAFNMLFLDNDLVDKQYEEGIEIEPVCYYPILPTILINSINGIALGYSFSSTNRSPLDIAYAVLDYLNDKNIDGYLIPPHINGLVGVWAWIENLKIWQHHGLMEVINTTKVHVTAMPLGWTYDSYESHLAALCDSNYMQDFTNLSTKGKILYELSFTRAQLEQHQKDGSLYHALKLYTTVEKDNLTVIDVDGKPRRYANEVELIKRFVEYRLSIYEIRKSNMLKELNIELSYLNELIRFIELIVSNEIKLDTIKNKNALLDLLSKTYNFETSEKLIEVKIYKLVEEEINSLNEKRNSIKEKIEYYEKTPIKQLYINDIEHLITQLIDEGYTKQKYEIWTK